VLGLPIRLSILIACGNSICGNSAIAAVAPVIGADRDDIAASISFTAILGVVIVLGLPLLIPLLRLSATQYGILAGLTVYAVPQVLAATMPAGLISAQVGTLVKLIRVLMLGPVVVALSLVVPRWFGNKTFAASRKGMTFLRFVPWFIVGFLLLSALRSFAIIPAKPAMLIAKVTGFLTIVSMAALGLGVDIRVLAQVGGRVTAAVTLSLMFLLALSIAIVFFFK
jgi:uncharacterized integral membrane protein (TIGR00698 family)